MKLRLNAGQQLENITHLELLASGHGQFAVIYGKIKSQVYQDIIQDDVRLSAPQLNLCIICLLQHDEDINHYSK